MKHIRHLQTNEADYPIANKWRTLQLQANEAHYATGRK